MLPNFLIVGAQKSGTSSLRRLLSEHPDIYAWEEAHFFDRDKNYSKGVEWYEKQFTNYSGEKCVGEKTPDYMFHKKSRERIKKHFPDIKLIFILRDPVKRAYSHYWMNRRNGIEPLSFEDAVDKEKNRLNKNQSFLINSKFSYLARGHYIDQILDFEEIFDESQLLILIFEEFKKNEIKITKKAFSFLDVDESFEPLGETFPKGIKKSRSGGAPRSYFLAKIFNQTYLSNFSMINKLNHIINIKDTYPEMKDETKDKLKNEFEESNRRLSKYLGKSLDLWV